MRSVAATVGPAAVIALIAAVSLLALARGREHDRAVDETSSVIAATRTVLARLLESESAVRQYTMGGNEDFLRAFRRVQPELNATLTRLRAIQPRDEEQRRSITQLESLAAARITALNDQVALTRSNAADENRREGLPGGGQQLIDSLRVIINNLDARASRLRDSRVAARDRNTYVSLVIVGVAALLGLAFALLTNTRLVRAARTEALQARELRAQTQELQVQSSDLQRAKDQLERERGFFDAILENMCEVVIACDVQGVVNFANRAARDLSPVPLAARGPERWSERYKYLYTDGSPMKPEDLPLNRALRGEHVRDLELILAPPDHSPIRIAACAAPLTGLNGEVGGAVVVARDVTTVLAAQEQLREADERLRQSQKMEAIGQLAGGIAHDFNNILTAIISYSQLALEGLPGDTPVAADVGEILVAANRARTLTKQLLAFSRRQAFELQPVDINDVVRNTQAMLSRVIGENVNLIVRTAEDVPIVEADPGQLEQILMNLVVNSRDAIKGRGTILLETKNAVIDKAAADQLADVQPGRHALVIVTDTGAGMDEETRRRVFEPFFTTKEIGKGTGLGLSTVYGIVRQSGGGVALYSEHGLGTTFKIYFPAVTAEALAIRETPPRGVLWGSETIMIVEDDPQVRDVVQRVLAARGYEVLEARNGREALVVLEQHAEPISLVITDLMMPEMGGRELVRALRMLQPDLPVLLISGYAPDVVTAQGLIIADARFIEKPFTTEALLAQVREAIDRRSAAA